MEGILGDMHFFEQKVWWSHWKKGLVSTTFDLRRFDAKTRPQPSHFLSDIYMFTEALKTILQTIKMSSLVPSFRDEDVPTFKIRFDVPPPLRYIPLAYHFKDTLVKASKIPLYLGGVLSALTLFGYYVYASYSILLGGLIMVPFGVLTLSYWLGFVTAFFVSIFKTYTYRDEIECFANVCQVSPTTFLFMQFCYEWLAACTTASVKVGDRNLLFRTMDWRIPLLKNLVCKLEFYDGDRLVYTTVSFAGCVSVQTGVSVSQGWACAINCRRTVPWYFPLNLVRVWMGKKSASYVLRHVLEKEMGYVEAIAYLTRQDYINPSYMTLFSPSDQRGIVLANGRQRGPLRTHSFDLSSPKRLVQTNHDWWDEPSVSWMQNLTASTQRKNIILNAPSSYETCEKAICSYFQGPVNASSTIFVCLLDPSQANDATIPFLRIPK